MQELSQLKQWFAQHTSSITAFSGGVDSALVLYVSHLVLGEKAIGLISNSESLKSKDFQVALDFCQQYGIHLEVIKTQELQDPNYFQNPANRCFYCKNHLYEAMIEVVQSRYPGYVLLNGTNHDDLGDYRPGIQASKVHSIVSPLAELGFTKKTVIELAAYLGLPNAFKPPSPCLSSRIPYGTAVTEARLKQIEKAEYLLQRYGFEQVRVRHHGSRASIEVPTGEVAKLRLQLPAIKEGLQLLGFEVVEIDEEGFVSGKLNRALHE
ncbi:MAG: ATP-dependent sacrificial sulfur transferase LarE [Saprospiraceae bacterium]|nr:ATP-dependent sacrificial sulfur transferase LarE [Saprospiraceae bacterium]